MVLLILIGAMILVGVPLYIQYRISGSPSANKPLPRAQSSWHHHHPTAKSKAQTKTQAKAAQQISAKEANTPQENEANGLNAANAANTAFDSTSTATVAQTEQSELTELTEQSLLAQQTQQAEPAQPMESTEEESEVCCGLHEVCEKLATNSTKVEYFDDEELDAFRGRDPESYNDNEIDQFRDVMTTMYPSEVALWRQSLQLRGVALPVELEDEFMLILSEV